MKASITAHAVFALVAIAATPALSAKLPPIKAEARNPVPACATPGRMLELLKARNPQLDPRYQSIATEYMRHGEELGLRWDYAFYQMIIETGALTYRNGNRAGDVKPAQNNFAGLGATGKGERGESFKDVSTGVRAHLQHLMMYAGQRVADPVAERTRKVQEWGVLTSWHAQMKGAITFTDMAKKWAPGTRDYVAMLDAIADQFNDDFCSKADPRPELVQEARAKAPHEAAIAEATPAKDPRTKADTAPRNGAAEKISGTELARRAVEDARAEGNTGRTGLGASSLARKDAVSQPTTILNAPKADPDAATVTHTAAAASAAKAAVPASRAAPTKCNVFTASYGGQKAVIIKAVAPEAVNYTVLDVNEGTERNETDAFIQAYAKGGHLVAEFPNQGQALDKAFELCPEG